MLCLDISDAYLQVPFALSATADEGRVQADCDRDSRNWEAKLTPVLAEQLRRSRKGKAPT